MAERFLRLADMNLDTSNHDIVNYQNSQRNSIYSSVPESNDLYRFISMRPINSSKNNHHLWLFSLLAYCVL